MLYKIQYLIFRIRWMLLSQEDKEVVWCQVHTNLSADYYDNYEQYVAAMNRGEQVIVTWQDLSVELS